MLDAEEHFFEGKVHLKINFNNQKLTFWLLFDLNIIWYHRQRR